MKITEIKDFIYNYFKGLDIFITETYLSEDDDFLTTEFTIKGIKHYRFGLWIYKENDIFKCSLFGEHKDYIDKFKPTATEISESFNIKGNESFIYQMHLFQETINKIKHCPLFMKYYLYCHNDVSFAKWSLREFWFYKIEKSFRDFFSKQGNYFLGICIKFYLKLHYGSKIDHIDVVKFYNSNIIFPCVQVNIFINENYIDSIGPKVFDTFSSVRGFKGDLDIAICAKMGNKWREVYFE